MSELPATETSHNVLLSSCSFFFFAKQKNVLLTIKLTPVIAACGVLSVLVMNAADFSSPVTDVLDGDTIKVSRNNRNVTIRLNGIDAPETAQAFGDKAGEFVFLHAFGQTVTVQTFGLNKYGRTMGDVYLSDGTLLNKELVKAGLAWWYCKYSADASLAQLEFEARQANLGLWQDPKSVPPWDYRKRRRGQSVSRDEMTCFWSPPSESTPTDGNPLSSPPTGKELATLPVIGNVRSGKYHPPTAQHTVRSIWRITSSSPTRRKLKRPGTTKPATIRETTSFERT